MDNKKLEELNQIRQSDTLTVGIDREKLKFSDGEKAPSRLSLPLGVEEHWCLVLMNFLILVPLIRWLAPVLFWMNAKSISAKINRQGKYILNWYISGILYFIVFNICMRFNMNANMNFIREYTMTAEGYDVNLYPMYFEKFFESPSIAIGGILIIIGCIMFALSILFPIIGGIKGWNKHTWKYPLSIPFLK